MVLVTVLFVLIALALGYYRYRQRTDPGIMVFPANRYYADTKQKPANPGDRRDD